MISCFFRSVALAGALASAGIAASPGTAAARTSYDGIWSVLIITQSGACERAYRYGVQISNGRVLQVGTGRPTYKAGSLTTEPSESACRPATSGPTALVACPATAAAACGEAKVRPALAPADGKRNGADSGLRCAGLVGSGP